MKLPNFDKAEVPKAKIVGYLLSDSHRDGRHKAAFFKRFGFSVNEWEKMRGALLAHANQYDCVSETSPFGVRYVVKGVLKAPDGREPVVWSVWFLDKGGTIPRFVTAYPGKRTKP